VSSEREGRRPFNQKGLLKPGKGSEAESGDDELGVGQHGFRLGEMRNNLYEVLDPITLRGRKGKFGGKKKPRAMSDGEKLRQT